MTPTITEESAHKFFLDAVSNGLHVYLNFQGVPEESYIFNAEEAADFYLAAPWPLEAGQALGLDHSNAEAGWPPPNAPMNYLN
jgi:hypothetical protein